MKIFDKVETVKTNDIFPYHNNPKTHPTEQIDKLCSSIKNYGFTVPLVIDADNEIIAGHGRYKAAQKLGLKELPVIRRDDLTDAEAKALRIADNKVAESEWDMEMLEVEFEAIEDEFTGFELDELDFQTEEVEEDDFAEEVDEEREPITKLGDVIELGRHRLVCGDSTSEDDVEKLMNGNKADMVFTDPPYGMNAVADDGTLGGGSGKYKKEYKKIKGDDKEFDVTFLLKYGCPKIIWGGNFFAHKLPRGTHWIVWDKRGSEMEGGSSAGTQSDCELAWTDLKRNSVKKYKHVWAGWFREGEQDLELRTKVHPTQKPVGMLGSILKDYTKNNWLILDLFGGSGSTLIAAEQLNRQCYMMELDEHYCDVIIRRYINYKQDKGENIDIKLNGKSVDYNKYLIE